MDLTELRATNPGLYEQAIALGVERECKRVCQHVKLATAAGASPLRAIENGWTAAEALPHYRSMASKSDETASAFLSTVRSLGLAGESGTEDAWVTATAKKLAATMGRGSGGSSARDPEDIVAEIVTGKRLDGSRVEVPEHVEIAPENRLSNFTHEEASQRVADFVTGKKAGK